MTNLHKTFALNSLVLACGLALSACSSDDDTSTVIGTQATSFTVVDGYIHNAKVCVKADLSSAECMVEGLTGIDGKVLLTIPSDVSDYVVEAEITVDSVDSDAPFERIANPYTMRSHSAANGFVTPFTTLAIDHNKTMEELAQELGLESDALHGDPTKNAKVHLLARGVVDNLLSRDGPREEALAFLKKLHSHIETLAADANFEQMDLELSDDGEITKKDHPFADISHDFADMWDPNQGLPMTVSSLKKFHAVLKANNKHFDHGPRDLIQQVLEHGIVLFEDGVADEVITFEADPEKAGQYHVMIHHAEGDELTDNDEEMAHDIEHAGMAIMNDFGLLEVTFTEDGQEMTELMAFYLDNDELKGTIVAFAQGHSSLSSEADGESTIPEGHGEIYHETFQLNLADDSEESTSEGISDTGEQASVGDEADVDETYTAVLNAETSDLMAYEDEWDEVADKPMSLSSMKAYHLLTERLLKEHFPDGMIYSELEFNSDGKFALHSLDGELHLAFDQDGSFELQENDETIAGTWSPAEDGQSLFLNADGMESGLVTLIFSMSDKEMPEVRYVDQDPSGSYPADPESSEVDTPEMDPSDMMPPDSEEGDHRSLHIHSVHFSYSDGTYLEDGDVTPMPEGFGAITQQHWMKAM